MKSRRRLLAVKFLTKANISLEILVRMKTVWKRWCAVEETGVCCLGGCKSHLSSSKFLLVRWVMIVVVSCVGKF